MERDQELESLAEQLHEQIWNLPAEELRAQEVPLHRLLSERGFSLAELLAELSDETLALGFRAGLMPAEMFTALLVDRYGPYLLRWLRRWGTESHQALDIVQQVYINYYERGLALFSPSENFRAYLRRSLYNLWVEKVCRARKHASLDNDFEVTSAERNPQQVLLDREATERIDEALTHLLPREQAVLRESLAGKAADEIAETLDLPKRQVFMALFRGRRRLEKLLSLSPRKKRPAKDAGSPDPHREPSHA